MIEEKSWEEFRDAGLLWWINQILHTFGWAIVLEVDHTTKELTRVYPARVKFRGFGEKSITEGYKKISRYMKEHAEELEKEANQ